MAAKKDEFKPVTLVNATGEKRVASNPSQRVHFEFLGFREGKAAKAADAPKS